jgi:hypothetical protein
MVRFSQLPTAILAVMGVLGGSERCFAGWLTITNETRQELILQDGSSADVKGAKRGKTVRLMPGEVYREYLPGEGQKQVQVFDAGCPSKPLFRGPVRWAAVESGLTVVPDATGVRVVRGEAAAPASVASTTPAGRAVAK